VWHFFFVLWFGVRRSQSAVRCRENTKDWYMFLFPVPSFCCCYYRRRRRPDRLVPFIFGRRSYCYMVLCGIDCQGNAYVCVNRKFAERFFLCGSVKEWE
jgi:hypothetical protein